MSISYRQLNGFITVARLGNVTRAARELHVSQPALTQTIRSLEDIVGTTLFDRSAKGVTLTRAGEEFHTVAMRLVGDIDDALEDLRALSEIRRGRVFVAGLPSLTCGLLPRIVAGFLGDHPNLSAIIHDGLSSTVEEAVLRGQCDFGLSCPVEDHSTLHCEPVADDHLELLCHADHPLATAEHVTWHDICAHKFIGLSRQSSTRAFVDRAFASVGRFVDPSYEVVHITTVAGIVAEGLGVTVVPRLTQQLINQPTVVFRKITGPIVTRQICLVRQADKSLSPAARILWQKIRSDARLWQEYGLNYITPPG